MSFIKAVTSLAGQKGIPTRTIYGSLGISQQRLNYWTNKDYISPSIRQGKRGKTALWSIYDLLDIKTILRLRRQGLSMQRVVKVIKWLRHKGYALHEAKLATDGERVWTEIDDQTVEIIEASCGQVVWIDWHNIVKECLNIIQTKGVDIDMRIERETV